jgi:hypothetical protein
MFPPRPMELKSVAICCANAFSDWLRMETAIDAWAPPALNAETAVSIAPVLPIGILCYEGAGNASRTGMTPITIR